MIRGHTLGIGSARGTVLKLDVPLSFWGGVDLADGAIIDRTHPRCGESISRRILAMPGARGSSSSSSTLVELARAGVAPLAIVMLRHDPILVIGALVATELYGIEIPVVTLDEPDWQHIRDGATMAVTAGASGAVVTLG